MFVNGVTESNNEIYIHGSEENLEKFAELIIRRCAEYCGHDPSGVAAMLEDFGLKETR